LFYKLMQKKITKIECRGPSEFAEHYVLYCD
jgi:hypothetical protein